MGLRNIYGNQTTSPTNRFSNIFLLGKKQIKYWNCLHELKEEKRKNKKTKFDLSKA